MRIPVILLCFVFSLLSLLAVAGLALIQQGLGRSRSAAHSMLSTLCVVSVSAIMSVVLGAGLAGWKGGPFRTLTIASTHWDWIGNAPLLGQNSRTDTDEGATAAVILCFQMFASGLAAIIPLCAGTDRWRLASICASTAVFSAFSYPMIAHWIWGGGWLSQISTSFGVAPFVDIGGAGVIQLTGGLMALSVAWILGPRRGKYSSEGLSTAIPGHNIVLVLFGCVIALIGWIGLEASASMLFGGATPMQLVGVFMNAVLSASSGCLAAMMTTSLRYKKPDASLSANGWIAGLVAGSAGCALISPIAAIVTGAVAGTMIVFLVELIELKLLVDDPGGSIAVHAGAGMWGLLSVGLFGPATSAGRGLQILGQLVGIATFLGLMLPWMHAVNVVLNRIVPYRVDRDGDWQGMDIRELGAGAYPEFVIHSDDVMPR